MKLLPRSFFEAGAVTIAPKLLGKIVRKGECEGIIVEVEAYTGDPASHAFRKPNQGRPMRETYGQWYVYFTYGMHHCANVTCDKAGTGGILIRAVEPTRGLTAMRQRRGVMDAHRLSTGPACFAEAFGIAKSDNGHPLTPDFGIFDAPSLPNEAIISSPRIGISVATDLPWRFYIKDNPFVSKLLRPRATRRGLAPAEV
jgi:DNA-3-methyladenine glycosylase